MIVSPRNRHVAAAARLRKRTFRDRERRFLVEGQSALDEALGLEGVLERLFTVDGGAPSAARARAKNVEVLEVAPQVLGRLASTVTPQGAVGVASFVDVPLESLPAAHGCAAVLCDCRDPGNAGTVLRSADAAGADVVVFAGSSVDLYNPKTVRATAGSLFHLPVVRNVTTDDTVRTLRRSGYEIVAASGNGEEDLWDADFDGPVAFLFGNEAWGLSEATAALADRSVRIPVSARAESLNLASAAAVCLFEWVRRARGAEPGAEPGAMRSSDEDLAELISAAAHDLRSPVAATKSFVSTLLHGVDPQTGRLLLDGIAYDAERMDLIVLQLVDAARLAAGAISPFLEPTDVGGVVDRLAEAFRRNPDAPEIRWEGGTVRATVDRTRLHSALASFIEAVLWYASEGPVVISGRAGAGDLSVMVERAGTHLTSGDLAQLFRSRRAGQGGGSKLGLYVTSQVAEALGGAATATIDQGRLQLHLTLPAGG